MVHVDSSSLGIGIDWRHSCKKRVTGKSRACTQSSYVLEDGSARNTAVGRRKRCSGWKVRHETSFSWVSH